MNKNIYDTVPHRVKTATPIIKSKTKHKERSTHSFGDGVAGNISFKKQRKVFGIF